MTNDEMVRIITRRGDGGSLTVYHTDADCYNITKAASTRPLTRSDAEERGLRCCDECAGVVTTPGGAAQDPTKYIRRLQDLDADEVFNDA